LRVEILTASNLAMDCGSASSNGPFGARTIPDLIQPDGVFVDGDWIESKDQDPSGDVRLIQLADVGDGVYRNKSARFLTSAKAKQLSCTFLKPGDLLIARMPDPLGRACIFPGDEKTSVTVVDVCIVRTGTGGTDHRWLMHRINATDLRSEIAGLQSGSTRKRISRSNLARIRFSVPALDEQRQIVAEIEKQFTRLDAGVTSLKRLGAALKRYRASVLRAACEGRLVPTEAELALRENRSYETGERLLQRILEERRNKWRGAGKYKEPVTPSIADLQSLPEGWTWCMSDAVFVFVTSGSRGWAKYYSAAGSIFLRIGNLNHEDIQLDLRDIQHVRPPKGSEGTRTVVEPNDILVSITADVGMVALVPEKLGEAYINQHVALARSVDSICAKYIAYYFCSSEGGWKHMKKLQRGATKVGLGLDDIRSVPIPLPPVAEQQRILAEVERQLSVIEELAAVIGTSVQRAERLRQSILMHAFSGRFPTSQFRSTYAA
jgi:type I restriction enzyme S subunit